VRIVSESRATDAAFRALADASNAACDLAAWVIVGGHMVNLHAWRAGVQLPARATRDADLAVDLLAVRNGPLLRRLSDLGYRNNVSSNRFVRDVDGVEAAIDLLAPSYSN
jgi:predicted nucleotidyltransferase